LEKDRKKILMKMRWKILKKSNQFFELNLLKDILLKNNIFSVIMNKKDSTYLFGNIELLVKEDDYYKANEILNKNGSRDI